eukprot:COSAG06_NODE_2910_length_6103_cov_2.350600_5_plen_214_part_00
MKGLASSFLFLPIISAGTIAPMVDANDGGDQSSSSTVDNVLMEWIGALELHSRGQIRAVMPVLIGGKHGDFFAEAEAAFEGGLRAVGQFTPTRTLDVTIQHLETVTGDGSRLEVLDQDSSESATDSVQSIIQQICKYQGVKYHDSQEGLQACTSRVGKAVSELLQQMGAAEMQQDKPRLARWDTLRTSMRSSKLLRASPKDLGSGAVGVTSSE